MTRSAAGLHWEEFTTGRQWQTGSRLVTEADIAAFSALTGDMNVLHRDAAAARAAGFDGVVAHGMLGAALATGLVNRLGLSAGTLVALLGAAWRFRRPLYPGTRIAARVSVGSRRETARPERGVVVLDVALVDGEGAVLQTGELTLLVRRGGGAGPIGSMD
jgi:3-hydroxybutyryl-CoA dehydratase